MNILLLPEIEKGQTCLTLTEVSQIKHVQQVLELETGDRLKVGSLQGNLGSAVIEGVSDTQLKLTDIILDILPPSKLDLTVILALPRPKVLRRLIMDMTAIGVREIILVNSYRTDKSYWQSPMLARIDEFVREGLQQGVDTIPPVIQLKKRFKPFVEDELSQWSISHTMVVAHPYSTLSFNEFIEQTGLPQVLCIGAEGGWIEYEVALLQDHGCQAVTIGQRILRTEAAVNALCGRYL
ncbi:16S rRNA (uracil(1498)-N(3))-methyltransferase [Psychrobacter sanguinis]|uniref:16S rRNA (uracil(1498)-N(3))-methyltransferase n=1 Tax=Psychrobacter sanguinis TaxID=861445 RepID=UPI002599FF26|nr:16S rRNA (uracil(1498)-N(3))-methyltransferase [Psychrobacter sanguinis]